ncbi:MAG TPA: type II toxin-antitoxin system VapC family toxin [Rhizomicrobium sp.]
MIVDSSAVVAILANEPEAEEFSGKVVAAKVCRMSVANFFEAAIVLDSKRSAAISRKLDDLVRRAEIHLTAVDETQARIAREAYRDFGKGSGHKAQLNFGDCFAYALAKTLNEPLLFKGNDFSHTDVRPAL